MTRWDGFGKDFDRPNRLKNDVRTKITFCGQRFRPRWKKPSDTGCSTSRRRRKAFAWMCCRLIRKINRRSITLLLAVTDRFGKGYGVSDTQAKELLARVKGEYERAYYTGILAERRAKAKTRARHSRIESLCPRWIS